MAGELTVLLERWKSGDEAAFRDLTPLVYPELHRLAAFHLRHKKAISFSPTELVHEAYLKLLGGAAPELQSRSHFFSVAARAMRQVLVDYSRTQLAEKRGGGVRPISLDSIDDVAGHPVKDLLALDEALKGLAAFDERKASALEMRYFGGMTLEQIGEVLGVGSATVQRDIRAANAWLRQHFT